MAAGEHEMQNWKKALIAAGVGASVAMFVKKRPAAGIVLAGACLVTLALEYPEQFSKVRRVLPDYFDRGMRLAEFASRAGEQIAEYAERRGQEAWREISS
jgi:hypothetical protein